jgi:tetratricopeptide (TPR) repeat protein
MGLFHDDFAISRSLLQPWTTLPAVIALVATGVAAVLVRTRLPLLSFAVLFFLAGHALESSVFPLELVYEHRNYLPAIAPLFALAYVPTVGASSVSVSRGLLNLLVAAVLLVLAASTAMRAYDWSGFGRLIVAEVENHPDSPRANFQFAQLLMEQIQNAELSAEAATLAADHFEHMTALNPDHADGLFGLVVLELYQGRAPPQELVDRLSERLRRLPFNPLNVNSAQFAYLASWHDPARKLPGLTREQMLQIFEAALANPTLPPVGRAAIHHALGGYAQHTLRELDLALRSAGLAAEAAPDNWEVLDRYARLLAITGRFDEAESVLRSALATDRAALYQAEAGDLADAIAAARRGEAIPSWSRKKKRRFGFDEPTP